MTMMLSLLAQATQPVDGMAHWGPADWAVFLTLVTTVIGSITTSIIAIMKASRNEGATTILNSRTDKIADHVQSVDRQQTETVARALQQVVDNSAATSKPPAPTPEAIANGLAHQPPENKP